MLNRWAKTVLKMEINLPSTETHFWQLHNNAWGHPCNLIRHPDCTFFCHTVRHPRGCGEPQGISASIILRPSQCLPLYLASERLHSHFLFSGCTTGLMGLCPLSDGLCRASAKPQLPWRLSSPSTSAWRKHHLTVASWFMSHFVPKFGELFSLFCAFLCFFGEPFFLFCAFFLKCLHALGFSLWFHFNSDSSATMKAHHFLWQS